MTENEKTELFDKWYDENYDEWAEGEEGIALREELEQAFKGGIAELENKIADIKANCDLAIEGRDIKIKELELELTVEKDQHQEETVLHLHAEEYIKSLEQQIEELKSELTKKADTNHSLIEQMAKMEEENAELKKKLQFYSKESANACFAHNEKSKKLKIAREIIALGLRVYETSSIEYMNLYQKQAEQFLKEIEK